MTKFYAIIRLLEQSQNGVSNYPRKINPMNTWISYP